MSNKVFLAFLVIVAVIVIGLVAWTGQKTTTQLDVTGNSTNPVDTNSNTTNKLEKPVVVNSNVGVKICILYRGPPSIFFKKKHNNTVRYCIIQYRNRSGTIQN